MAELSNIGEQPDLYKLFVGQIPKDMDEISLRPYFEEFGHIVEISVIRDNVTMMSKGCAFVTYSYEHAAQMAVDKLHDKVQLPNSMNPLQVRFAETQVDRDNKLFIGMLPKTVGEQDLHDMFSIYGDLREVHVIRGPDGGAKGCAFVKFIEREAALAAIDNLHDTVPPNATRPLVVKFADGKKPKEDPWQQMSMYRHGGGPMHHMGAPPQRMMYPYGQHPHPAPGSGYHAQQAPGYGGNARYGYAAQGQGAGAGCGYYPGSSQDPQLEGKRCPAFGQQEGLLGGGSSKPPSDGGEFSGAGRGDAYDSGLDVRPPPGGPSSAAAVHMHGAQHFPADSESSHVRPPEGPSGANLFIYHLPRDLTDADLATLFAPFGNVISAKVFVDKKTSDSKGFGFVSYDTLENANSAIESMNGFQIGSKRLKVQHKRVMGGPHTSGMAHSPYGAMMHGASQQHVHMGHHAGSPYQQHQQQAPYSYRPQSMQLPAPQGVMMPPSPLMQQPQGYGGLHTGLGAGGYPQQLRGTAPPAMGMPAPNRMEPAAASPGRSGGYSYPSYPVALPTYTPVGGPQQSPEQRPGMLLPSRGPEGGYGGAASQQGYPSPDVQQQLPGQQQQQIGGTSMAYGMDGGSKALPPPPSGGGSSYYGHY